MATDLPQRDPVEVLGEEFLARRRRGEDPQIGQYARDHEQYADQIRELFPAMIAMEDFKVQKNLSSDRPIQLHVDRLERLGDYRIVREIGHGGMGIVYEAEQQSLRRRVAVKVFPKQAIGDSKQLKRFQREAETAGGLHHTNIVPVFGVGQQDGLHYFVMQLLDGVSLDDVIAGLANLDVGIGDGDRIRHVFDSQRTAKASRGSTARNSNADSVVDLESNDVVSGSDSGDAGSGSSAPLRNGSSGPLHRRYFGRDHWRRIADIGIQVADALHYAHGKGVMHRDIKPSNLILGADSRVWVTDFGLAVSYQHDRLSRSGEVVGTLRYMSPEQLNGRSDQRSDIYGLGLTLFELMTLRPAFDGNSRGELIRKVSKSIPPTPRSLCREIPKDLETIVLRAIARSPANRYKSALEFADDLRRFRNDQPIRARRISPLEHAARWSRRNPALAGMSAALLVCIIGSFAAVSRNWRQAVAEKQHAEREGQRAENNLALALVSMDRMLERFESDWMSHPIAPEAGEGSADSNAEATMRFVVSDQSAAILEEALDFYDQFAFQNSNSPKLQRDRAKAHRRAGDILERLGRYDDAERAYDRSLQTMQVRIDGLDPAPDVILEMADVLNRRALVLHRLYRSEDALAALEEAKRMLSLQVVHGGLSDKCTYQLALTHSNLGLISWRLQDSQQSTQHHRQAVMLLRGLVEQDPLDAKTRVALARAYRHYYPIAAVCKERIYSSEIHAAATEILEQLVADFPNVPDYRCELSEMLLLAYHKGHVATTSPQADIDYAVSLAQRLCRLYPSIPRYETALARALVAQAKLQREDDPERAAEKHQRAVGVLRALRLRFPKVAVYRAMLAGALREYGTVLRELDDLEESICVCEEAVAEQSVFLQSRPDSGWGNRKMSSLLNTLAETLEQAGDTEHAADARRYAETFWKRRPSNDVDL